MASRRILLALILLLVFVVLLKPRAVWSEFRRIRSQWNTILGLLVVVIVVYLVYGLYTAWESGAFD